MVRRNTPVALSECILCVSGNEIISKKTREDVVQLQQLYHLTASYNKSKYKFKDVKILILTGLGIFNFQMTKFHNIWNFKLHL